MQPDSAAPAHRLRVRLARRGRAHRALSPRRRPPRQRRRRCSASAACSAHRPDHEETRHVRNASHHRHHRLVRRRHHLGHAHLREHLPPRERQRGDRRRRQLPSLRPRSDEARRWPRPKRDGNRTSATSAHEANLFAELEALFRDYAESGTGRRRKYLHDDDEAAPYEQEPGTFTAWEDAAAETDLLFYEGLHGAVVHRRGRRRAARRPADRRGAGDQPRMDPEAAPRQARTRGYSTEAVTDTILRRMHDYVHYICPQFSRTHINFQRVPVVDTSNPFIARTIPTRRREPRRDPLRQPEGHRLPLPADMLHDSFMSRANTIVVPGGKMELAMQLIFTPLIWRMLERKQKAPTRARPSGAPSHERRHAMLPSSRGLIPTSRRAAPTRSACSPSTRSRKPTPAIPGMPMGMAEIAEALWRGICATTRPIPHWPDRDRFVLSNGHGSMLQYALLHLTGYDLPIEELQALPPVALEDAGPSRGRRHARRRNDDRPARPGPRQRGRHGAGREAARPTNSTGPATRSSTTTPTCSSATAA